MRFSHLLSLSALIFLLTSSGLFSQGYEGSGWIRSNGNGGQMYLIANGSTATVYVGVQTPTGTPYTLTWNNGSGQYYTDGTRYVSVGIAGVPLSSSAPGPASSGSYTGGGGWMQPGYGFTSNANFSWKSASTPTPTPSPTPTPTPVPNKTMRWTFTGVAYESKAVEVLLDTELLGQVTLSADKQMGVGFNHTIEETRSASYFAGKTWYLRVGGVVVDQGTFPVELPSVIAQNFLWAGSVGYRDRDGDGIDDHLDSQPDVPTEGVVLPDPEELPTVLDPDIGMPTPSPAPTPSVTDSGQQEGSFAVNPQGNLLTKNDHYEAVKRALQDAWGDSQVSVDRVHSPDPDPTGDQLQSANDTLDDFSHLTDKWEDVVNSGMGVMSGLGLKISSGGTASAVWNLPLFGHTYTLNLADVPHRDWIRKFFEVVVLSLTAVTLVSMIRKGLS